MSSVRQQKWKKVEYSRSKIIKSGKIIRKEDSTEDQIEEATRVIDNWRAAHAFPLHVIYIHLRRMAAGKGIVVAERLKRLDSIIKKLEREPSMSLWMMQDLGGCRFIVPNLDDVYFYAKQYDASRKRHIFKEKYDYIAAPKPSGYRSLHMVYEYHSDKTETYNKNMLVEIQYRTHLQHLWATALETMGLFTKQALKAGQGEEYVKRFFVLVSSLFAIRENCPVVPGTVADEAELISEIEQINDEHHILETLNAIRIAIQHKDDVVKDRKGYYLLILNYNTHRLKIGTYLPSHFDAAEAAYTQIEKSRRESNIDAVLVRAKSFNELKSAYPNYFTDIGEFYSLVTSYLR